MSAKSLLTRSFFALAAFAVLAVACGNDGSQPDATPRVVASPTPAISGKITVFAASSLTDAFGEMAAAFKEKYRGTDVEFQFGGSPTLRTQLEQGARADIYVSADQNQMSMALQNSVVESAGKVFVRNSLVVITPSSNPGAVITLADLAKPGLKLVVANRDVPVGNYSRQMLMSLERDAAYGAGFSERVLRNVVSEEANVRQVVTKVELGEADIGIVYGTDVTPSVAPKLKQITVPTAFNVIAEYPIAIVKGASNATVANAFIEFVLSAEGQAILKKFGFQTVS